ncbi:MAG: hypothetical protein AAF170_18900 [Bacteroidota bacterium]
MRLVLVLGLIGLSACVTSRQPDANLTPVGTVLDYEVVTMTGQRYPFVVTVTQNDADGRAFSYNLGDGVQVGTVFMTPEAMGAAPNGMLNQFGSEAYRLTDRTSVWMARSDVRRLNAGTDLQVNLEVATPVFSSQGCSGTFAFASSTGEASASVCMYAGEGGEQITVLNQEANPLIMDMGTGAFRVTLQRIR